jgi:hypothetical protein
LRPTRLQKSDRAPSIFFESYTGGAPCCSALFVVIPIGDSLDTIEFRNGELYDVTRNPRFRSFLDDLTKDGQAK